VSGEFGMQSSRHNMTDKKYKQLVDKLLDVAINSGNLEDVRKAVDTLRVLADGVTYNAVLRCIEDIGSDS
jgi:hypothetical protein